MKAKRKKMKPAEAWGGFVDGKLDAEWLVHFGCATLEVAAIFPRRRDARAAYQDVRPVLITERKGGGR